MFGQSELKTEKDDVQEDRDKTQAELQRCWGAYALSLLRYSWEFKAKRENDDRDPDVTDAILDAVDASATVDLGALGFTDLDPEKLGEQESKVAFRLLTSFDEVRKVFLFGTNCLDDSKTFYTKDDFCTDYVAILQSSSQFYKVLASFELDVGRQCKMHKRRIDSLSDILKELNQTYYLLIMRQLMFEIGEAYGAMMDLKYAAMEGGDKVADAKGLPTLGKAIIKINALTKSAIASFQDFIKSFYRKSEGSNESTMPSNLELMDVRPVLLAYFHIARLYTKYVEADTKKRVLNMEVSKGFYQKLVDYVDAHRDVEELVKNEYDICRELIPMMEIKINTIRAQNLKQ